MNNAFFVLTIYVGRHIYLNVKLDIELAHHLR